jgi:hypothetical protein
MYLNPLTNKSVKTEVAWSFLPEWFHSPLCGGHIRQSSALYDLINDKYKLQQLHEKGKGTCTSLYEVGGRRHYLCAEAVTADCGQGNSPFSYSRNSLLFLEPECSWELAVGPFHESDEYRPHTLLPYFLNIPINIILVSVLEYPLAQLAEHCATSWKVSGSIPYGVIGIFHWHNPSGHTMVLGSTQLLTEMSTRNISWVERQPAHRADNLTTFVCWLSRNLGAPTSWNPQDLSTPVQGLLYLYLYLSTLLSSHRLSVSYLSTINFTSVSALCATCPT